MCKAEILYFLRRLGEDIALLAVIGLPVWIGRRKSGMRNDNGQLIVNCQLSIVNYQLEVNNEHTGIIGLRQRGK